MSSILALLVIPAALAGAPPPSFNLPRSLEACKVQIGLSSLETALVEAYHAGLPESEIPTACEGTIRSYKVNRKEPEGICGLMARYSSRCSPGSFRETGEICCELVP